MDGLTSAQIRAATVTALQADATVTAIVASGNIVPSRSIPLTSADGPSIIVWAGRERLVPAADQSDGMQVMAVESDVIVDFTAPEVGADIEALLDSIDVITAALLSSSTWMRLWNNGPPDCDIPDRWRNTDGDRFWGQAQAIFTVRHLRAY